jgi:hypothetical protein
MALTLRDIRGDIVNRSQIRLPGERTLNFCEDCLLLNPPIFTMKDWPFGKALLCWNCTQTRLGADFKITLNDAPCNSWLPTDPNDQRLDLLIPILIEQGAICKDDPSLVSLQLSLA